MTDTHHTGPIGHAHDNHQPVVTTQAPIQPAAATRTTVTPAVDKHGAPVTATVLPAQTTTGPGATVVPLTPEPAVYSTAPAIVEGPPNHRPGRGFLVGILSSIALIFWFIAITTPIALVDGDQNTTGKVKVDPWHACSRLTDDSIAFCRPMGHPDESCTRTRDTFRVEQAFLVLTGVMLVPLLTCAALDFSHKLALNTPDLPCGLSTHGWTILFGFITALVSCIAFAIAFAIPRIDPCGNGALSDNDDFAYGPSPIFSLLIFVISIAIIIIALILRENGTVKPRDDIMHHDHPNHGVRRNEPLAA